MASKSGPYVNSSQIFIFYDLLKKKNGFIMLLRLAERLLIDCGGGGIYYTTAGLDLSQRACM